MGYPPGGGGDKLARVLAEQLGKVLKQPVQVINKSGASGTLAGGAVFNAAPDGYTLLLADSSLLVASLLYEKVPYVASAFTPISALGYLNYAIVVNPALPASNLATLIELLKAKPNKYNYASPGLGTIGHLSAELLQQASGVSMTHIAYKGGSQALIDLISGDVQIGFLSLPPSLAQAKINRLRILAVTSRERSPEAPAVPTVGETLQGFHLVSNLFLLAPPGLPARLGEQVNTALQLALATPEMKAELGAQGAGNSLKGSQQLSAQIRDELQIWRGLVKPKDMQLQ
jgi:tripartite-type tricarboxylate transporter receptor subunit TctC